MAKSRRSSREGEVLAGKYRLDAFLGAGGMGEVYRAENIAFGRFVAIKMLKEEHAESSEVVTRFLREARAANLVRHPNVVDILDIGQAEDGAPFIVQELLEGEDLGHYVDSHGGRLGIEEALDILIPVVDAVALAHERGVIHRDLKPENVFLARTGSGTIVPKLLDFGISRIVTADEQRMTATGMSIGTPAYMSPETIRADKVIDARADVWSIGVILHELLTGALPFQSESHSGLFVKIVTEPPVPLDVALPGAPPELAAVVDRCLRAKAIERYANAGEVRRDLRVVRGLPPSSLARSEARPPPTARQPNAPTQGAAEAPLPSARAPGPPPVVPELAMPASKARVAVNAAPASGPRSQPQGPLASPLGGGQRMMDDDFSSEIIQTNDLRLDLTNDAGMMMRPSVSRPVARATHGMRTDIDEATSSGARSLLSIGVLWCLVLAITGALSTLLPSAGWPVVAWASALARTPAWAPGVCAGVALLLGVVAFVAGARAEPTSWGLIVAAPALIADALMVAGFAVNGMPVLTGTGGLDALERALFPWPTMMIFVGLSLLALRYAWTAWSTMRPGRTTAAGVGVVLAAVALFGAVQIARGAESTTPSSSNFAS